MVINSILRMLPVMALPVTGLFYLPAEESVGTAAGIRLAAAALLVASVVLLSGVVAVIAAHRSPSTAR